MCIFKQQLIYFFYQIITKIYCPSNQSINLSYKTIKNWHEEKSACNVLRLVARYGSQTMSTSNRAIDRNCANTRGDRLHAGGYRGVVGRHQISPYFAQFKIESACAQTRKRRVCIHFTIADAFITTRKLRLELHKFPAVSGERWWDISGKTMVEPRERIGTSEIYFWEKEKSGKLLRD